MEELGVARIVESLAAVDPASAAAEDIEQAMIEAARRFAMGLMGQTAEEKVGEAVARSAGALQSSMAAAAGEGFFLQGAQNKAAVLLDSLQVRITGIVDPEKRAVSGDPDGSKRRAMDGAMRMVFGSMFMNASAPGRGLLTGEGGLANDRAALQDALRRCGVKRAQVEKSALSMLRLAPLEERREALRAQLLAVRERSSSASIAAMKAAAKALGKAPSRLADAERLEAARNVRRIFYAQRRIGELTAALAGQDEPDPARMEELRNLHVQMDKLRRRLDGIDPATLLRTRPAGTHPSLAELSGSFEAARAVIYFAGEFRTKDKAEITRLEAEIRDLNKRIGTSLDEACALFGKDNVVRLNHAVAAAFMDVYVRSGAEAGDFLPHSADVLEQVRARLNEWGIPAGGGGLIEIMTQRAASRLSAPDGSLDVQAIDLAAALGVQDTAIQRAASQQALREQGSAVITGQTVRQRDRIAGQMAQRNREARLAQGLGNTLASLGRGEGFTFSMSKGLEIGLEANPDISGIIDARIVALTPSVTVGALRENELSVHADGQGGFMVSMRTEDSGSIGLGLEFDLGVFGFDSPVGEAGFEAGVANAKAEGKLELGSANGVMLHFSSAEDCSAFLTDFMSLGSSLRRKDGNGGGLWLTCDSLFTVEGGHVTKSFSLSGSLGGFEAATLYAKAYASGPSATMELSSTTRTSMEQNVHGYTEVKQASGKVSFSLAKGPTVSAELSIEPGVEGGFDLKGGSY